MTTLAEFLAGAGIRYEGGAAWGARPPTYVHYLSTKQTVQLHHAAMRLDNPTVDREMAQMRQIQDFHMDVRRWSDIAYGLAVGPTGTVYEGRGLDRKGGGAGEPADSYGIAVLMLGNYHTGDGYVAQPQTAEMRRSLSALWHYLHTEEGYVDLKPHREVGQSACPGNTIQPPYVDPYPPHTPDPPPEDDMTEAEMRALLDEYIGAGERPIRAPIGETNKTLPAHTDLLAQLVDRVSWIEEALGKNDPNTARYGMAYPRRTLKRVIPDDEES